MEYILIIFSTIVVYLFIVLAIRIFGKKEIAQLSVIDLVFILLISNSVQNAMMGGNNTLIGGIIAAATLFIFNFILKQLFFRYKKFDAIVEGNPVMLIYHGKILHKHLQKTEISVDELEAAAREHGVENIAHVDLAVLEIDGNISILSNNFQKRSVKKRHSHKPTLQN